jgi:hypothetical protein
MVPVTPPPVTNPEPERATVYEPDVAVGSADGERPVVKAEAACTVKLIVTTMAESPEGVIVTVPTTGVALTGRELNTDCRKLTWMGVPKL